MSPPHLRPSARLLAFALLLVAFATLASCLKRGYPLGRAGHVDIRPDVAGALFATDTLDSAGKPSEPRQEPYRTGVTLALSEGSQAAYGAFVEVRVEPAEALALSSDPDETPGETTCALTAGAFRCLASERGIARFIASSESDWSGKAKIVVSWADQTQEQDVDVLPPGLPATATNFSLIVGDGDESARVLATFLPLSCSLGPVPDNLGSKWRKGQIRVREAYVRATPPSSAPGVVENAPVIVEVLRTEEAGLSLNEDCEQRRGRLRVVLDKTGQSPPFYLCFSDVGGTIPVDVSSGEKVIEPDRQIIVDPEPRLLRVRVLSSQVTVGPAVDLFEISAYNADRVRITMPVDLKIDDDQVLGISHASLTLAGEENVATVVQAAPLAPGKTVLHVSPRLLSQPDCVSDPITVVPSP